MAQKITTHLIDDLTGDVIEDGRGRQITFAFDGTSYEIDLADENAEKFRDALSDYVAAARKTNARRGSSAPAPRRTSAEDLAKIREWANANGYEVAARGRISTEVQDAYRAAH